VTIVSRNNATNVPTRTLRICRLLGSEETKQQTSYERSADTE
jgi:hypothetical protein